MSLAFILEIFISHFSLNDSTNPIQEVGKVDQMQRLLSSG